jgi:hypothetical protein
MCEHLLSIAERRAKFSELSPQETRFSGGLIFAFKWFEFARRAATQAFKRRLSRAARRRDVGISESVD